MCTNYGDLRNIVPQNHQGVPAFNKLDDLEKNNTKTYITVKENYKYHR